MLEKLMLPRVLMRQETYDQQLEGTWEGYLLPSGTTQTRIWTPAGTVIHWSHGNWLMPYHRLQSFWSGRWYTLNSLYRDHDLYAMYAHIIQPPALGEGATYTDLGLAVLVNPDYSYEVLDLDVFEHLAETLHYPEEVRIGALMALDSLIRSVERRAGPFLSFPPVLPRLDLHLLPPEEVAALLGESGETLVRDVVS
jgi:protein associated with RNAse G/E